MDLHFEDMKVFTFEVDVCDVWPKLSENYE